MKNISLPFLLLLSATLPASAQQLHISETHFMGSKSISFLSDMAYNPRDKSLLWCGASDSCGSGILPPCPQGVQSSQLVYVLTVGKIDSNRNRVWTKTYGSPKSSEAHRMAVLPDGGYALAGIVKGNGGNATGNHGEFSDDMWLLRLDSAGNLLWQKCFGGVDQEYLSGFTPTSDGGFLLVGITNSGTSGDVPFTYINSQFTYDWLLIKTDSLGNKQWATTFGGTKDESDYPVKVLQIGGSYYVCGSGRSVDHECDDLSWQGGKISRPDFFLIKFDSVGNYLWNKSYGSLNAGEAFNDAVFDPRDTSIVMVGFSGNNGDHFVPPSPQLYGRTWALKLDTNGQVKWSRIMGDTARADNDWQRICLVPQNKGYLITAHVRLDNLQNTPGYFGNYDVHAFLIDSSGKPVTDLKMGGSDFEDDPIPLVMGDKFLIGGRSYSATLNEGATRNHPRGEVSMYFSYLDLWPLKLVETQKETGSLNCYPNPAENQITVEWPPTKVQGTLRIYSTDGKLQYERQTHPQEHRLVITTEDWARGQYLIKWQSNSSSVTFTTLLSLQ